MHLLSAIAAQDSDFVGPVGGSVPLGTYKRGDKSDAVKTLKIRLDQLEGSVSRNQRRIQRRHGAGHKDFKYLNTIEVTSIANPDVITKLDFSDAKKEKIDFGRIFHFPYFLIKRYKSQCFVGTGFIICKMFLILT
ncbi:MAG: hypothetical protein E6579_09935 [Clostridium sp.]|nr:hypothetical protein [Clostridium sp.]MDU6346912.1 hypothetical protein [Clostridium sp.]